MNQETQQVEGTARNFTMLLSPTPRGAHLARLLAVDVLRGWGIPDEAASHVVAELAANAATHGRLPGRSFRLSLHLIGSTLRIEVTDTRGDRLPEPQAPDAAGESGRGLLLVEALADRWGVIEARFPHKIVWAELTLTPPEPVFPRCGGVDG
ncbi:ATP-binding protein [Streptomyces olivaceus]